MGKFKLDEILQVTKGRLIQGEINTLFKGISTDSRSIKRGELFLALKGQNFDGHDFVKDAFYKGARGAIVEKDIKIEAPKFSIIKVERTLDSLREIASFHRNRFRIPLIGITGSNGKTTVKEMTYHILSTSFNVLKTPYNYNNQIGIALTLLELNDNFEVGVFEMGINRCGEMELLTEMVKPEIAVFTNIGKSHLEFLNSPENVLREKMKMIHFFSQRNIVVFNGDDPLLREGFSTHQKRFKVLTFGIEQEADFRAEVKDCSEEGISFKIKDKYFFLPLLGIHNLYNALAAITVGYIFGISLDKMASSLKDFSPPKMRLNIIEIEYNNGGRFTLIDDTYNANPNSLKCAIDSLFYFKKRGKRTLVLADMLELGKYSEECHREIGRFLKDKDIDLLLTIGRYSSEIGRVASSMGKINWKHFSSNQEIIEFLRENIGDGDILLLKGSRAMHLEEVVEGIKKFKFSIVSTPT